MDMKFVTLREDSRLSVFENREMKKMSGPKRDEIRGHLRKLHNDEFRGLYSLRNIIRMNKLRRMTWTRHVARLDDEANSYRSLKRIHLTQDRGKGKVVPVLN
jgi:hypothetical protein